MPSEGAREKGHPSGSYFAGCVRVSHVAKPQKQLQDGLNAAEEKEWHLVAEAAVIAIPDERWGGRSGPHAVLGADRP